jgi:tetratricopeptide (TPR) repeat protein
MTSKPRSARAEQARLAGAMRAHGCSWRQVADEFVRRWGITYLQAFRLVHGLSQEQAAARYNARWQPERPLTGKHLSYWETWPSKSGKEPSLGKLGTLAAVYECSVSDLLADVGDHRSLDSAQSGSGADVEPSRPPAKDALAALLSRCALGGESSAWQAEYTGLIHALRDGAMSMRRRDLLAILSAAAGAAYAAPVWNALDPDGREQVAAALSRPRMIDEATVAHIERALYHTMRQEEALGPQAVMQSALAQQSLIRVLLGDCPGGPLHARLLSLHSDATRFIGWSLFNLNDYDAAARQYELARSAAHEAGSDVLSSYTLCDWSLLPTWCGDPRLGVEHALGGLAWGSRAGSDLLSAYSYNCAARAYAALVGQSDGAASGRERAACRDALDRARQHVSAARADDPASRQLYFCGPSMLAAQNAWCLLDIGTPRQAHDAAASALQRLDPKFPRNIAFCRLTMARSLARQGELEQAARELKNAAEIATRNRSLRLRQSIAQTRELVCVGDGKEVGEVDEFLREHRF